MLTLHPQSAMEHLHARFRAADGSGSDGAIAFEATEVAPTSRARTLVPVRPAEPLAGAPDRSPIPLADNVQAASAAMSAAAGTAREAAGGAFERLIARAHDFMPQRKPAYRRVTPLASRRETQRRAALAVLALVTVVGGLGLGVYAFGGQGQQRAIGSVNAGQEALDAAKANLASVSGPGGIDLVEDDPEQALQLLTTAYTELDKAEDARVSARVIDPIREDVVAGLDRLYGVIEVGPTTLFDFKPAEDKPAYDLKTLVRGPDGAPYVIDGTTASVYRIDLKRKRATAIVREGREAGGTTVAVPRFLVVGGRDLLILDGKNVLWRWRPSNDAGKGTLNKVNVNGATQWGDDITIIGTYLRDTERGLANLYVVDPSEEQVRVYFAALDGGGFPVKATGWLETARDVSRISAMYIDGDMFVIEGGVLERFASGRDDGWEAKDLPDGLLREPPTASLVTGQGDRREGTVFTYDRATARLIEYEKASGDYLKQYRLAGEADSWGDIRGMYVVPGIEEGPPRVFWVSATAFHQAFLEPVSEPDASASPGPGSSSSQEPSTAPSANP
jgi:hypothetical protein